MKTGTATLVNFSRNTVVTLRDVGTRPNLTSHIVTFGKHCTDLPRATSATAAVRLVRNNRSPIVSLTRTITTRRTLVDTNNSIALSVIRSLNRTVSGHDVRFTLSRLHCAVPGRCFSRTLDNNGPNSSSIVRVVWW